MEYILEDLGNIARALNSISNIEFKPYELTRGQYLYLVRICEQPGIISEQLSSVLRVDRSTVSRSIKKLEANGLIIRKDDKNSKKNKRIYPTDLGKQVYPIIKAENEYSNKNALAGLTSDDIKSLANMLKIISRNIDSDWQFVKNGGKRDYIAKKDNSND